MKVAALELKEHEAHPGSTVADFNPLAPFYRWMEWFTFGPFLWKCRLAFLPEMRSRKSALILGDGDGRFTARLLQDNPQIEVDAVDASEAMLRQLVRRAGANAVRVRTQLADARQLSFRAGNLDLVATHFFLRLPDHRRSRIAGKRASPQNDARRNLGNLRVRHSRHHFRPTLREPPGVCTVSRIQTPDRPDDPPPAESSQSSRRCRIRALKAPKLARRPLGERNVGARHRRNPAPD